MIVNRMITIAPKMLRTSGKEYKITEKSAVAVEITKTNYRFFIVTPFDKIILHLKFI